MPIIKSAIKQVKQVKFKTHVNRIRRSKYRSSIREINILINKKKKKEALKFLPRLISQLMKVAKTGVVSKRKVSRNISRITKKIYKLND